MLATGKLHGLPITVADAVDVAGMDSTWGGITTLLNDPKRNDSPLVAALREEGAIVVAKTNMSTAGICPYETKNEVFGEKRNPWSAARAAGGSSGGSAVAAAVGAGWLHLAVDAGGLMRSAAAFSGVVDFRPSDDRTLAIRQVSQHSTQAFLPTSTGLIARSVADVNLAAEVMFKKREFSDKKYTIPLLIANARHLCHHPPSTREHELG